MNFDNIHSIYAHQHVTQPFKKEFHLNLDLIMPGMDGGKTFDRIKEIEPGMRVILSTGYTINGQANDILRRGCNGFIQKPFNMTDLSKIIRKILDEAKG